MAQGTVTTNNLNLGQGETDAIERKALFVIPGTELLGELVVVNAKSDLEDVLSHAPFAINTMTVAQANGGENWEAAVTNYEMGDSGAVDLERDISAALEVYPSEFVCVHDYGMASNPGEDITAFVNRMQTFAELQRTSKARRIIMLLEMPGAPLISGDNSESWGDYLTRMNAVQDGVAAPRVALVPRLHDWDMYALAGRLCNSAVSVADSPMRVATGPVLGLGESSLDVNDAPLTDATIAALDAMRFSCIQHYTDYPGTYWGDCNLLDAPGGDYQVVEHLRVVDKAARRIRVRQINRIANRQLNSTASSIENNRQYFMAPLREMSRGQVFAGQQFPGDIHPPADDDVQIDWPTNTKCVVYFKARPYNSPKTIEANILLDLSQPQ